MPMRPVPVPILTRFDAILEKRAVAPIQRADYKKREKRQTPFQQNQAAHAVSLYFEMQRERETPEPQQVRNMSPSLPQSIPAKDNFICLAGHTHWLRTV